MAKQDDDTKRVLTKIDPEALAVRIQRDQARFHEVLKRVLDMAIGQGDRIALTEKHTEKGQGSRELVRIERELLQYMLNAMNVTAIAVHKLGELHDLTAKDPTSPPPHFKPQN